MALGALAVLTACGDQTPAPGTLEVSINLSLAPGITPDVVLKGPDGSEKVLTATLSDPQAKVGDYTLTVRDVTSGSYLSKGSASESSFKLEPKGSKSVNVSYQTWGKANITVEVVPASSGFSPVLTLTKGSSSKNLTATGGVDLEPGSYSLSAADAPANYTRTLSANTLNIVGGQTTTLTLRYERQSGIVLGATGLPNGATVYATPVGGGTPVTAVYTSGQPLSLNTNVSSTTQFNLSAVVAGQIVDSLYVVDSGNPVTVSPNQTTNTNLSFRQRAGTGRIWVAGNGGFSNGGRGTTVQPERNAAYSLTDGASSLSSFIPVSAVDAPFRINFDRAGNMYAMYQYHAGSSLSNSIVRISEANLRQWELTGNGSFIAPSQSGNARITQDAFTPSGAAGSEPADLAFDRSGNLWIVNDYPGYIACVSATRLNAGGTISQYDQVLRGAGTNEYGTDVYANKPFLIPHALGFDRNDNLWFTSGGYGGANGKRALLNRLNASRVPCSGGDTNLTTTGVDISLDVSLVGSNLGDIVKPVTMTLEPSGEAIWVGDFGGQIPNANESLKRDANPITETVFRVRIDGLPANPTPTNTPTLATSRVTHRLTVAAGTGIDKGMQQPFGLAFDTKGFLWVATNNNVEVMSTDIHIPNLSDVLTDRRGKLYQLDVRDLSSLPTSTNGSATSVPFVRRFSVTDDGVGLIGVFVNLPNPATPLYLR